MTAVWCFFTRQLNPPSLKSILFPKYSRKGGNFVLKPDNTQRLCQLMAEYSVSPREVAEMLNRSYQTVLIWRSVNAQNIPDSLLELLELKLLHRDTGADV